MMQHVENPLYSPRVRGLEIRVMKIEFSLAKRLLFRNFAVNIPILNFTSLLHIGLFVH